MRYVSDKEKTGRLWPQNKDHIVYGLLVGKGYSVKIFEQENVATKLCFGKNYLQCVLQDD